MPALTSEVVIPPEVPSFVDATLQVTIRDVGLVDRASEPIAQACIAAVAHHRGRETKISLRVALDEGRVQERSHYAAQVWLDIGSTGERSEEDLFSDEAHPILTHGWPSDVQIVLRARGAST
ncbi:hypothetical protein GRI89_02840 [Altererythrobacter salegens]|uniref:Uncharacterized protein n=1 Tax=Croceibacterium salegens TaxID=1737568 RepID=A0A6I4SRH5_9SPHN|nr:hypothetical protein [Croceibacterium salegens]MXO58484.1 hypothetical protein [Croceibacterium salegens]